MTTNPIARDQWASVLDELSRQYVSGRVTILNRSGEHPAQTVADNLPLVGISFDPKGSEAGSIAVAAGDDPDAQITFTVHQPYQLGLTYTGDGRPDTLQIESQDEATTIVQFHSSI